MPQGKQSHFADFHVEQDGVSPDDTGLPDDTGALRLELCITAWSLSASDRSAASISLDSTSGGACPS